MISARTRNRTTGPARKVLIGAAVAITALAIGLLAGRAAAEGGVSVERSVVNDWGSDPQPEPDPALNPDPDAAASGSPADRAPLSTDGAQIVDRNGDELIIQGVNWFGFETRNHIVHGLWARDYTEMLAQIRDLGFNAIRIPFSLEALKSNSIDGVNYANGANSRLQGKTPLQALDLIVEEAGRQGLLVMLDNHSTSDDGHMEALWHDGAYSEGDWVAAWETLARRYRDDTSVVAADLHNEPHGEARWGGGGAADWRRAATRAGNAVGSIAPHWLIVVEGTESGVDCQQLEGHWWGGNLEGERCDPLRIDRQQQLVFSPHEYGPGVVEQAWFGRPDYQQELLRRWDLGFDFISQRNQDASPILIGEFGGRETGTETREGVWQRQFMDFLSDRRHSWTYWSWNPNSGDTGGVLNDDWTTVNQEKIALLQRLQRNEPIPHPAPHTTPPDTTVIGSVTAKKTQGQKGKKIIVRAKVRAGEDLSAKASGKINAGKSYKLKPRSKSLSSGQSTTLKLKPKKRKDAKKIAKRLKRGKKAKAKLIVKLTDRAGNKKTEKLSVKLKR